MYNIFLILPLPGLLVIGSRRYAGNIEGTKKTTLIDRQLASLLNVNSFIIREIHSGACIEGPAGSSWRS
jgi:hypothetical protein